MALAVRAAPGTLSFVLLLLAFRPRADDHHLSGGVAAGAVAVAPPRAPPPLNPSIDRGPFVTLKHAPQLIYQDGVPHTDRNGRPLTQYDPKRSFLPLTLYDPVVPCSTSSNLSLDYEYSGCFPGVRCPGSGLDLSCHGLPGPLNASIYERAGFTAVMPDPGSPVGGMTRWMSNSTEKPYGLTGYDLQIIREWPSIEEVRAYKDHPQLLAWYLSEEPIGSNPNMSVVFDAFADQAAVSLHVPRATTV